MLAASASVASFSTSDGWKLSEPTVTHAVAPLIVAPTCDVNGNTIPAAARIANGTMNGRQRRYGTLTATSMPTRPKPAHISCREKIRYGELPLPTSVAADDESTITRPSMTNTATTTTIT